MKYAYFCLAILLTATSCNRDPVRVVSDFNRDWEFALTHEIDDQVSWRKLDLPHDWSIEGSFDQDHPATPGGGALPGGKGTYRKSFVLGPETEGKRVFLEFDGIYRESRVFVNGHPAGYRPCGYSSFSYEITPFLNEPGEENLLSVTVDNSRQPNSRWYSGSGIYRNVRLVITSKVHIPYSGTYVTTPRVEKDKAQVDVRTEISGASGQEKNIYLLTKIMDTGGKTVAEDCQHVEFQGNENISVEQSLEVKDPAFWDVDNPVLYTVESRLLKGSGVLDDYRTPFGIRTFRFTADSGFYLNE
ncbi:MAG: beta-galactosidase, partial [Desulfoplanes sp.]|nr:beta-galactosidase [Desulfoplanes sp.]